MKRRFDTYFPWLFTVSDFFASLLSLAVANFFLQRFHVLGETEFSAYLPLSLLWILISILRKDYKIGRTDEFDATLSKFSITLIWFLGATAILWTPLQVGNYRWIQIGALGATLGLLMGLYVGYSALMGLSLGSIFLVYEILEIFSHIFHLDSIVEKNCLNWQFFYLEIIIFKNFYA
jgi:hypothetical protein